MVVTLSKTGGAARIYCVNGGGQSSKNAAAWLEAKVGKIKKRRGGQGGTGGEGEIRLIQDFDFPEASNKIKSTRDGQFAIATGTYKPRMRVFDLPELSLKTERVTDSENVDFCILSSDWTKTLHLQADRSIDIHTQAASIHRVRTPKHGRAIAYHFPTCDAVVGGQGNQVWRLNLELGRFMKPLCLEGSPEEDGGEQGAGVDGGVETVTGVNAIDINPAHQLLSFGTETAAGRGTVEMWDPRSRTRAGILRLPYAKLLSSTSSASLAAPLPGVDNVVAGVSVTALSSKADGLNMAVGTSTGHVLLYDLRANRPYNTKDQGYGLPIKKIEWVEHSRGDFDREGGMVASVDERVVKVWGRESGANLVSINPPDAINDMHIYPSSGLMMLANEAAPMTAYYVPQLGPAPKWCRFLDNMTEEMEDDQETLIYDDYKFIDRNELEALNLSHLVGTDTLRPYMHGYFVDLRLYTKAKAIANPFQFAEHRDRLIREKMEKEQESRIRGAKVQPDVKVKVNKQLARKVREAEQAATAEPAPGEDGADVEPARKRKKKSGVVEGVSSLLKDDRFADLFKNPDFEIDEGSREFALLNPSAAHKKLHAQQQEDDEGDDESEDDRDDRFNGIGSEDDDDDDESSEADSDSSLENDLRNARRPAATKRVQKEKAQPAVQSSRPTLVEADDSDLDADDFGSARKAGTASQDRAEQSLGRRIKMRSGLGKQRGPDAEMDPFGLDEGDVVAHGDASGEMEMSFIPSAGKKQKESAEAREKKKAKQQKEKADASKFGAGLDRWTSAAKNDVVFEGEEGSGRQRMRKGVRSASKNVIRKMQ